MHSLIEHNVFECMLRSMYSVTRRNKVKNVYITECLKTAPVMDKLRHKMLVWI